MLLGAERLGLPGVGGGTGEVAFADRGPAPAGIPLVLYVNAPLLPLALARLGRSLRRGRRIIGYWAWELPGIPRDWHPALKFVHEV